ncbi:MAG: ligase-associated DNA damage response DEXH box helicase [Planctomycetota bacterium]
MPTSPAPSADPAPLVARFFESRGWSSFPFQQETRDAYAAGRSGLVHAPTGLGKTLAVWMGPIAEAISSGELKTEDNAKPEPIRAVWITPLRALASDTARALSEPIEELGLNWSVQMRTGDTSSSIKAAQRKRLPTVLVTTPESITLLLSYPDTVKQLKGVRTIIVDEWHELLSSKRGTQTELALARLRTLSPGVRTWGLSATLGNLEEAADALVGVRRAGTPEPALITGRHEKEIRIRTIIPKQVERFPWAGHLGLTLLDEVIETLEPARTTLLFTNTRSQAELWHNALRIAKPEWEADIAIHHGSIDRASRDEVERRLAEGSLRVVCCTSSLDLGVDFSPVEQVLQVGSPKGVARLMQRAGRSGHQPGAVSSVWCVPAHAFELVEFAAAREATDAREIESRIPLRKPLDVLVQHLVTVALGGGFDERTLLDEVRTTHAYRDLSDQEWSWCLDFVEKGGNALGAYPQYTRLRRADDGRLTASSKAIERTHRMGIGTITSDSAMLVKWSGRGGTLGTIEESFIGKLRPGDRFVFAGHLLEMVRVRQMTVEVKKGRGKKATTPRWQGGRSPLSSQLALAVRRKLDAFRQGDVTDPELEAIAPLLEQHRAQSVIPEPNELLIETTKTRDGHHAFLYPFEGRLVHEGLGSLLAYRITRDEPRSIVATVNDYGVELLAPDPLDFDEPHWRALLSPNNLLQDLLECVNSSELARRRFRDIARVAGLINPGFPGENRAVRHLQASSELFFDVFRDFDPENLLLDQARREVLDQQLEVSRLRGALERLELMRCTIVGIERFTPMSFPLYAERLRAQHVSTESWMDQVRRLSAGLEEAAG